MNDCFAGLTALITGASSGLGEQLARQLATHGCKLIVVARSEERLQRLATELRATTGVQVVVLPCDLSEATAVTNLHERLAAQQLEVDLLVNNAAQGDTTEFLRSDEALLARMVQLNDVAPLQLTRRLLPGMQARGRGGVINVVSTVGFYPVPFMAGYGASKAFLLSFSLAVAEEMAGSPLRVLTVCPGPMRTRFQENAGYQLGRLEKLAELEPERVAKIALRAYARRRRLCSPGLLNVLQAFLSRLVPLSGLSRLVGSVMRSLGRHESRP